MKGSSASGFVSKPTAFGVISPSDLNNCSAYSIKAGIGNAQCMFGPCGVARGAAGAGDACRISCEPRQQGTLRDENNSCKSLRKMPDSLRDGCEARWAWSRRDKSHEVRLYGKKLETAHFHPNWSNGTAGVRGNTPLNYGRHYWEIKVSQRIFGTSMMFGIGTKHARIHADAFVNLLGEDDQSWGLSHKGLLWHNGKWRRYCSPFQENESTVIGMLFDWSSGTLTYFKDGERLGIAYKGLHKIDEGLYPIVCSTAAKTEMTLGQKWRSYNNLQDRCRATILTNISKEDSIDNLPLPNPIRQFLRDRF